MRSMSCLEDLPIAVALLLRGLGGEDLLFHRTLFADELLESGQLRLK